MAEDPDRIREQIVATRERLGDTAEAIARKADLRSRVRERTLDAARSARERLPAGARDRLPQATAGAVACGLIAGLLIPLRRARRKAARGR
jgi:hypothetical protein